MEVLEEDVKTSILQNNYPRVLAAIIDLVLREKELGPIFSALEEPIFYRYFRRWVLEGLESLEKIRASSSRTG